MNNFEEKYKGWHQKISFIKSGVRIAACLSAATTLFVVSATTIPAILILAIGLGLAEILGIFEEWM